MNIVVGISNPSGGSLSDRIQRGGGSVVVSGQGAVLATLAADSRINPTNLAVNQFSVWDQLTGTARTVMQSGRGRFDLMNAAGSDWASLYAANITASGTITVSGTGPHPFGGTVKVTPPVGSIGVDVQGSGALGAQSIPVLYGRRGADARFSMYLAQSNDDAIFYAHTGTGIGTLTESLRIVNANGYVSVATRLGIGTASPSYAAHVAGSAYISQLLGVNTVPVGTRMIGALSNGTATSAAYFEGAASATVAVVIVKGGATPGAGGDLQQWQDSNGAKVAIIASNGAIRSMASILVRNPSDTATLGGIAGTGQLYYVTANTQTTVGGAGAAGALPATPAGYLKIDVNGTAAVVPYYAAA